jgi:chemotaxis protein methyltransferase CheR
LTLHTDVAVGAWNDVDVVKPLSSEEFQHIRDLAHRTFGLDLKVGKEELVSARLRGIVRTSGFDSFDGYYRHVLRDSTGAALAGMIDALATNHTSFMREPDHFEFLCKEALPTLASRQSLDIWCAACSTGEEVWTLAFLLNDALPSRTIRITSTDISNKALRFAERAVYSQERCKGVTADWMKRYFVPDPSGFRVCPRIRSQATFRRINLVKQYSRQRLFPIIFCRNVMIYFDAKTQEQVVGGLADCLEPGGYLFVGHAESLNRIDHSLEYIRPAVYRKSDKREGKWTKSS